MSEKMYGYIGQFLVWAGMASQFRLRPMLVVAFTLIHIASWAWSIWEGQHNNEHGRGTRLIRVENIEKSENA